MHLQRIRIRDFKNLRDLEITFNEHHERANNDNVELSPKRIRSHAVIGQNGTGKSNLIEAIITIFRDLDLNKDASLDYELDYKIRGHEISLVADTTRQKRPVAKIDGKQSSQTYLSEHAKEYLPSHIFTYYSGKNERLESLFQAHQKNFSRILKEGRDDLVRRLFYCRGGHSQLVLLACLLSDDPVFAKLLENLNIESLESALFVLKQPYALRKLEESDVSEGDPRFWYARGTIVREFLDHLWRVSWAPMTENKPKLIDFRGRTEEQKLMYLFVPNEQKLRELGSAVGAPDRFFRYAEGAYIGDLIDEVRITVKKRENHGGKISFTQLSEGELQMLTVLGLMRITSEDHCLFLLDEPDTHLNPMWKLRYFDDIENVLKPREDAVLQGESQIIITTHDPMMIGSLKREQVRILRREDNKITVDIPDVNPQGMGITGLLKSELFGLSSTLDPETERRLHRRNYLFALGKQRKRDEEIELTRLSAELSDLGFSTSDFKDPYYAAFVSKMALHTRFQKPALTPDEQEEQDAIADEIIDEILREEDKE